MPQAEIVSEMDNFSRDVDIQDIHTLELVKGRGTGGQHGGSNGNRELHGVNSGD